MVMIAIHTQIGFLPRKFSDFGSSENLTKISNFCEIPSTNDNMKPVAGHFSSFTVDFPY